MSTSLDLEARLPNALRLAACVGAILARVPEFDRCRWECPMVRCLEQLGRHLDAVRARSGSEGLMPGEAQFLRHRLRRGVGRCRSLLKEIPLVTLDDPPELLEALEILEQMESLLPRPGRPMATSTHRPKGAEVAESSEVMPRGKRNDLRG